MKQLAPFAIALLVSCASSSSDIIDDRVLDCGSGQKVSIEAGLDTQQRLGENFGNEDRFELLVNVANLSHEEITVKAIRAEQSHVDLADYRMEGGYRRFNQVIEEGKEHTFHLPMTGRVLQRDPNSTRIGSSGVELAVTVVLANGDSYRCLFEVGGVR